MTPSTIFQDALFVSSHRATSTAVFTFTWIRGLSSFLFSVVTEESVLTNFLRLCSLSMIACLSSKTISFKVDAHASVFFVPSAVLVWQPASVLLLFNVVQEDALSAQSARTGALLLNNSLVGGYLVDRDRQLMFSIYQQ